MKKLVYIFLIVLIAATACERGGTNSQQKPAEDLSLEESIALLEEELFNSEALKLDRQKALKLIRLYEQFVNTYPEDEASPEYLFKAGDISMNMRRPKATISLFDRMLLEYPDYEKSPSALFLKAFVYEDQLQDFENARINYELFLSKYPDSEFADDAEVSLQNLGKSPEELIRQFEQN